MGMYDNVRCVLPLPDGFEGNLFQTKSFEAPYMRGLVIAEDRRLYEEIDGERKLVKDYHGYINFYEFDHIIDGKGYGWHEYDAKFTDGECVEITVRESGHAASLVGRP